MSDARFDYLEYINSIEDPEIREYVKKFYNEYYAGNAGVGDSPIIKDDEIKKEARRLNNNQMYETMIAAKKDGNLQYLDGETEQFIQDACDEWEWERELKMHGYQAALKMIEAQALRDLDNKYIDNSIVLMRYYEQRDRLRRMENKEKRDNGKKKKT